MPDVPSAARNAYLPLFDMRKADLVALLVTICSCMKPPTRATKEDLCRRIIWAQYGVDIVEKPEPPDPLLCYLNVPDLVPNERGGMSLFAAGRV